MHGIPLWILVLSLFVPRITLVLAYLGHQIPIGHLPDLAAILMWAIIPRVLMLIYIYVNLGLGLWFVLHLAALLIVWGGSGKHAQDRWG